MSVAGKVTLLADVGGTNTRIAVAQDGVPAHLMRYENADYASLYEVMADYVRAAGVHQVQACSVAMAGPVRAGQGRVTNRGWVISTADLKRAMACDDAVLMNDLTALGFALNHLPKDSIAAIETPSCLTGNGQSLVVGIGTGFNLCPVLQSPDGVAQCLEVEMGHAALPAPLRDLLAEFVGAKGADFTTLEHLFSGVGLARFHLARGGDDLSARGVVEAHAAGNVGAGKTLAAYTTLLGMLCREMAFQYMPLKGMYFAGSVARGVLQPEFYQHLSARAQTSGKVGDLVSEIPKWMILDDAAALRGCLAAAHR